MRPLSRVALFALLVVAGQALTEGRAQTRSEARLPIIDMHLHAREADYAGPNPPPLCAPFLVMPRWDVSPTGPGDVGFNGEPCTTPIFPARTTEQVRSETMAIMEKRNIIGMISGAPDLVATYKAIAPERVITGFDLRVTSDRATNKRPPSIAELRALHARGGLQVLGEVMAQYEGVTPDDRRLEPYWALAEELDIPVGIHIGAGGPGDPYFGSPGYRARNSSALGLEDVLVRHPKLRVYVMHAGYPLLEDMRALLFAHPQAYVDISSIVYVEPRPAFYRYLEGLVEAGFGDRILFGSDQMIWPGVIEPAIESVERAPFLSAAQKRDIFYNNAARFLRLTPAQIARHHAM